MNRSLHDTLLRSGAVINGASRLALHFGEPATELEAACSACGLVDRSDLTRLLGRGPDLLDLLHRLSTADLKGLAPGEGRVTVLTTPKGRIFERLFVHHLGDDGVLLVGGTGSAQRTLEHLARYTFAERTDLQDRSPETCQLAVVGPRAADTLDAAGFERPARWHATVSTFEGYPVRVLGQDGMTGDGFSLVVDPALAGSLWQTLNLAAVRAGGRAVGELASEAWRIIHGIPAPNHELTEEHNPLEAGLWDAVSFDKGCYVGQEVVARLRTYDKVARELVGLRLPTGSTAPTAGTPLFFQQRQVGRITSAVIPPGWSRPAALGYLKRRNSEPGIELAVGGPTADLRARRVSFPMEP